MEYGTYAQQKSAFNFSHIRSSVHRYVRVHESVCVPSLSLHGMVPYLRTYACMSTNNLSWFLRIFLTAYPISVPYNTYLVAHYYYLSTYVPPTWLASYNSDLPLFSGGNYWLISATYWLQKPYMQKRTFPFTYNVTAWVQIKSPKEHRTSYTVPSDIYTVYRIRIRGTPLLRISMNRK